LVERVTAIEAREIDRWIGDVRQVRAKSEATPTAISDLSTTKE
jgi:hypothetical protein